MCGWGLKGGYWAGNLFGVWEQLKLGAYYRRLFCFITSLLLESFQHQSSAIGENQSQESRCGFFSPEASTGNVCLIVHHLQSVILFKKNPVVCVQHKGGSDIRTYPDIWVWFILMAIGSPLKQRGLLSSSEWTLYRNLPPWGNVLLVVWSCWCLWCLVGKEVKKKGVHSVLLPLFLQTVTVTEVPPGFPLQTHFCFFRFILFLSLLLSYFLSKQTHVFVFCLFFLFLVGLFFQDSAKASYVPPPFSPSFLTHVWIISMKYFWVLFYFHMTVESIQLLFVYYSYSLMIS